MRVEAEMAVFYKVEGSSATGTIPNAKRNISVGGVRLALPQRLVPRTQVELELILVSEPVRIRPKAQVVWSS